MVFETKNNSDLKSAVSLNRANDDSESIDILRFLEIIIIHKWLFLSIFAVIIFATALFSYSQKPKYISKCEIFYNETLKEFSLESGVTAIKNEFDKNYWISLMKSERMGNMLQKKSKLPLDAGTIQQMLKIEYTTKDKKDGAPAFELTVSSPNREIVPIIIKSFVESLNEILTENQAASVLKMIDYLSVQLQENNNKLIEIDEKLYSSGHNTNGLEIENENNASKNLERFRSDLINTQIELSSVIASKIRTENELKSLDGTIVNQTSFSEPLKAQLMNLLVELAKAQTLYRDDHPTVIAIRSNINHINELMRDTLQQRVEVKSYIQNPFKAQLMSKLIEFQISEISLQTRLLSIQQVVNEFQSKMSVDSTGQNYQQLMHNREIVYLSINQLNSRLIEAQSAAKGSLSRFVIIDNPSIPNSASNADRLKYIMIGIMLALILSIGTIFVYDMLDNRIKLPADYERFYSIPILGNLCFQKNKEMFYPQNEKNYPIHQLNETVVHILKNLKNPEIKVFSICSAVRKEGKTTASMKLARDLAKKGLKVLLVDLDRYIPRLTKLVEGNIESGISNFLNNENNIHEITHTTNFKNLFFTGIGTNNAEEISMFYTSEKMIEFIAQAKKEFDIVLIDTPAILSIPEIVNFVDNVDKIIMVARIGYSPRKAIDKMLSLLIDNSEKIEGVILNGVKHNFFSKYTNKYYYDERYTYYEKNKKVG